MSSRTQITGLMALGIALLLALLTGLCWHFTDTQSARLSSERNHFLLTSLRRTAEDFLATGMTPEQMPAMQDVIDREKASFPQLLSIDLFTPSGRITYSTDAGAFNAQVPADWVEKLAQSGAWETLDPLQDQLGMRFENNLGRAAGGIVLTLQSEDSRQSLEQWRQTGLQLLRWLALAVVSCCAVIALGLWQLRRSLKPYQQVHEILSKGAVNKDAQPTSALQQQAVQADIRLREEEAQANAALQRLQELDHGN